MTNHPIEGVLKQSSARDRAVAEKFYEAGFSDEDLYAALPNPKADGLLKEKPNKKAAHGIKGQA